MQVWVNRELNGPADTYDYDMNVKEGYVELTLSHHSEWTVPGSYAGSINDTGDGLEIDMDDFELSIDYAQAERLLALLLAHYDGHMEFRETKTIKRI
mgnify:CR=1 FL=1